MNIFDVCNIALDTIRKVDHFPIRKNFYTVLPTEKLQGSSDTNALVQTAKLGSNTGAIAQVAAARTATKSLPRHPMPISSVRLRSIKT